MKRIVILISFLFLLQGCSEENIALIPIKTNLIFPFENSVCNEGTNITATESTVLFEWWKGEYTDNYELKLKNLASGEETFYQTTNTEMPIVINRATPYEWYITSLSNTSIETVQSNIWKFYNAGDGIESYPPFPAEIISPTMAEMISTTANEITLDWNGSDADDDIQGYDVYFGTTNTPELIESDLTESILNTVSISPNTIYYWKVITKDSRGNTSDSGVYQFKIL